MNILFAFIFALFSAWFAYDVFKEARDERRISFTINFMVMLVQLWTFVYYYGLCMNGQINN